MKNYNQPTTNVVCITLNQGICQIASSPGVEIAIPSEFGDGGNAN